MFHFWPQNGTQVPRSTLNWLFHESDDFLQGPFLKTSAFYLTLSLNTEESAKLYR